MSFPCDIEAGNAGDGQPLTLGDPVSVGDGFLVNGEVAVFDWDGDGQVELIDAGTALFTYRFAGEIADGTPKLDRGLRWGEMSRSHQRDEHDRGLCGRILAHGDFHGDGRTRIILGPRGYSRQPVVVLQQEAHGWPADRSAGTPLVVQGFDISGCPLVAFDWNGDGRLDLIAAQRDTGDYYQLDEAGHVAEDQRDRYSADGVWRGRVGGWTLHLLRNDDSTEGLRFVHDGTVELAHAMPGGPMAPVDKTDPSAGLLLLGDYGELFHLPLLHTGDRPQWGELSELSSLHGAPFTRYANFLHIDTAILSPGGGADLIAGDVAWSACWCRYRGADAQGRPIYDDPRKMKQDDPHVNGGAFSVPTVGDWRGTGTADLLVGGIEGYVLWYKPLSTEPLRFAPPERVRVGDEEIRRYAKPRPAAGVHWGSSQGPLDGFNGGYSNPVLVDWSGDGLLDLLVGDMIGLFEWYPNRGTATAPRLEPSMRLHVGDQPLFGPWRVQPGAGDFTGDGLPDLVTMDVDLDLVLYRRRGRHELSQLEAGEKLRYEDGAEIKTHGVYTAAGGDGRGRTKIQIIDWDGDGRLDLLIGSGPQQGSAFRSSYVMLCRNVGSNAEPVFARPEVLLFDEQGEPLEFWRHGAHMAAVDWDGDGCWELLVGADMGNIWYFRPEQFGAPRVAPDIFRPADDNSL